MKKLTAYLLLLLATSAYAAALPDYSTRYDPARDVFSDGRAAIQLAASTNRKVLIEVGGDWCAWCHVLDQFLHNNQDVQQQLHDTFVMLKVNVSETNDNAEFLRAFPKPLGYPHMYITDNNGKILWSQDTAEFLQQGKYSRQRMLDFIARWKQHE
ncbi:MAG: thioredoxin family protein [Gammaproteobacteria bacterium]|jgi:thiol:disulfide interchange protein|nr:thioredoxin family protein [Gammaproteobacteria bacterium]